MYHEPIRKANGTLNERIYAYGRHNRRRSAVISTGGTIYWNISNNTAADKIVLYDSSNTAINTNMKITKVTTYSQPVYTTDKPYIVYADTVKLGNIKIYFNKVD